ncbi:MAG: GNAT family N-acetyltransferase [Proteobacteria bacterium]|nr:GNAT family N-acetyltransferase [Pseudomonadota bacterium]
MGRVTLPRPLIETDDRARFDCGQNSLNHWFQRHAWNNQVENISRVSVICDKVTGDIAGFVTLSSTHIQRAHLPKSYQRHKPDPVPVTLLGQLAVHMDYQGEGHARALLLFALRTAFRASQEIASFGVLTHPIDNEARAFYLRWGFEDLSSDPHHAMIVRMVDLEKSGIIPDRP